MNMHEFQWGFSWSWGWELADYFYDCPFQQLRIGPFWCSWGTDKWEVPQ